MSILINKDTAVVVQGITGKEGSRATHEMMEYGTRIEAGVTPGKGGTFTEDNVPVFNSVAEAIAQHGSINTSFIAVPGRFVRDAVVEAIDSGIKLINILSERVPVADTAYLIAYAKRNSAFIVGPSSVGIISPVEAKLGSIGSAGLANTVFVRGHVGLISKSGGMTSEIGRVLTEAGIGQSTALGIGGDQLIGADFCDVATLFERDQETRALVIFGEIGGVYEMQLAEAISRGAIKKPVVALIAGIFAENLPSNVVLGHAGALVEGKGTTARAKISALRSAGAYIAQTPEEIVDILKKIL